MSKRRKLSMKLKRIKLPSLKIASPRTITIFELGNLAYGVLPTAEDMDTYRELISDAIKNKHSTIFVPEGYVKVRQIQL